MEKTFRCITLCALILATAAAAYAQPTARKAKQFTGSDEELGALIAWMTFKNKADNQWWYHGGAEAAQDVFVTELRDSRKFRVVEREQLQALMKEKNLTLSGDIDPATAVRVGKLLGVNYLLVGSVTEYGVTDKTATAAVTARLIDTSTGEIVWADEAKVSVGGFGGGVDDDRMFEKVMKPAIQQLTASLKSADL
jgi:curli biogenesis system outer membrane secretion channel CsgG